MLTFSCTCFISLSPNDSAMPSNIARKLLSTSSLLLMSSKSFKDAIWSSSVKHTRSTWINFGDKTRWCSLLLELKFRLINNFLFHWTKLFFRTYLNIRSWMICCRFPPRSSGKSMSSGKVSCGFPRITAPKCNMSAVLSRPPKFDMYF